MVAYGRVRWMQSRGLFHLQDGQRCALKPIRIFARRHHSFSRTAVTIVALLNEIVRSSDGKSDVEDLPILYHVVLLLQPVVARGPRRLPAAGSVPAPRALAAARAAVGPSPRCPPQRRWRPTRAACRSRTPGAGLPRAPAATAPGPRPAAPPPDGPAAGAGYLPRGCLR